VTATVAQTRGTRSGRDDHAFVVNAVGPFAATPRRRTALALPGRGEPLRRTSPTSSHRSARCSTWTSTRSTARRTLVTGSGFGGSGHRSPRHAPRRGGVPAPTGWRVDAIARRRRPRVGRTGKRDRQPRRRGADAMRAARSWVCAAGIRFFERVTMPDGRVIRTVGRSDRRAGGRAAGERRSQHRRGVERGFPRGRLGRAALPVLAAVIGLGPVRSALQRLRRQAGPGPAGDERRCVVGAGRAFGWPDGNRVRGLAEDRRGLHIHGTRGRDRRRAPRRGRRPARRLHHPAALFGADPGRRGPARNSSI